MIVLITCKELHGKSSEYVAELLSQTILHNICGYQNSSNYPLN